MAFTARKVTWHGPHLLSNVKLLISLLLASMTVATCLTGDGKHQMDSKRVWDSTIRDSIPAEMKEATMQILDTSSEPKLHLDEMTTTHLLIDETNNSTTAEKQLNLNSQSREMMNLARLKKNISATETNKMPTGLPNMSSGTDPTKKSHIIFNAYTEHPTPKNSTVTYTKTNATDGNPVDSASGVYTVKTPGFYGFIFHALTNDSKNVLPTVELRVNGTTAATAAAFNGGTFKTLTLIAGAKLKRGDQVSIFVADYPLFHSKKGSKHRASFAGTLMI